MERFSAEAPTAVITTRRANAKELLSVVKPAKDTSFARVATRKITASQKPLKTPDLAAMIPEEPTFIYGDTGGGAGGAGTR